MVEREVGETALFERSAQTPLKLLHLERAGNPHHVDGIVGMHLVPLEHRLLKTVQPAMHSAARAARRVASADRRKRWPLEARAAVSVAARRAACRV